MIEIPAPPAKGLCGFPEVGFSQDGHEKGLPPLLCADKSDSRGMLCEETVISLCVICQLLLIGYDYFFVSKVFLPGSELFLHLLAIIGAGGINQVSPRFGQTGCLLKDSQLPSLLQTCTFSWDHSAMALRILSE